MSIRRNRSQALATTNLFFGKAELIGKVYAHKIEGADIVDPRKNAGFGNRRYARYYALSQRRVIFESLGE